MLPSSLSTTGSNEMRALLEQVRSRSQRRGQLSVYQFQKTSAVWLGLVLFIYSVLLFGFAFAGPFVLPTLKLVAPCRWRSAPWPSPRISIL